MTSYYFDTSAWMRLLIRGRVGHTAAMGAWHTAEQVWSVRVTYAETLAALALSRRQGELHARQHARLEAAWGVLWPDLNIVDVDQRLVNHAGQLAKRHSLRGYDAVQLAAARRSTAKQLVSADTKLNTAARRLRLRVLDLNSHN